MEQVLHFAQRLLDKIVISGGRSDRAEQGLDGLARNVTSFGAVDDVRPALLHHFGQNNPVGETLRFKRDKPFFDVSFHPPILTRGSAESIATPGARVAA